MCAVCGEADIGFILDDSSSINSVTNWNYELNFVERIISLLQIGPTLNRIGVVKFSRNATLEFGFTKYTTASDLDMAVRALNWTGGDRTDIAVAFQTAIEELFSQRRPDKRTICILITDGQPNSGKANDTEETYSKADFIKQGLGIEIFAIGVGKEVIISSYEIRFHCTMRVHSC